MTMERNNAQEYNPMFGAIIGDIAGSQYEYCGFFPGEDFELFTDECRFTDDSVLTIAVAKAFDELSKHRIVIYDYADLAAKFVEVYLATFGTLYPKAGYGGSFMDWLFYYPDEPKYDSYGNGAAMRCSAAAYFATSLDEAETLGAISTYPTHMSKEGVKAAKTVAGMAYLAFNGALKDHLKEYASTYYDLSAPTKLESVYCQDTVPQAINVFLKSKSFEDCIRKAIAMGYDTDTRAAIAGSIAAAYYGIPEDMWLTARGYLTDHLRSVINEMV